MDPEKDKNGLIMTDILSHYTAKGLFLQVEFPGPNAG